MSRFTIKPPEIFIQNISSQPQLIEGVSTSTAAFLGETQTGPITPTFVTSFTEYQRVFGGFFGEDKYLPYAVEGFFINGGKRCFITKIQNSDYRTALASLEAIDEIALVYSPNAQAIVGLADALIDHCERLKNRFVIFDSIKGQKSSNVTKPRDSSFAALYYPWIYVKQDGIGVTCLVPPGGHVAGIYARTDLEAGVHKAPANQLVKGAVDLEVKMKSYQQDSLNLQEINSFRNFAGRGLLLWGVRTLSGDPAKKYINVCRLLIYLEQSIKKGTAWAVFEPNNKATWAKVKAATENFLTQTWKYGMILGTNQQEAYFVECGTSTMTQNDIDNGRLIVLIGVAPVKPAEFIIIKINQMTASP
jgi:phage tail sheath protein FI